MFIWGRLLGVIIGFMAGGFLGAALGFVAGIIFDKSVNGVLSENLQGRSPEEIKATFMRVLFTALGDVAKADGRITGVEIAHTEKIIKEFGLDARAREKAIGWFNEGANADYDYQQLLKEFAILTRGKSNLKRVLLEAVINLAMVEGTLDEAEEKKILHIASGIGIPSFLFQQILNALKSQQHFNQNAGSFRESSASQLENAYQALGISSDISDKDLKKTYRKLMSENHPDKLIAKGVPESVIKIATEKSQAIQGAYEVIKNHRK